MPLPINPCGPTAEGDGSHRRALLIGINKYLPAADGRRPIKDLNGAVNDVAAMRALLSARYGYREDEICELKDEQATRVGILRALNAYLITQTQPGDAALFFFAGHGSTAANRFSTEPDKLDETIVPTDAAREVPDVRDKELSRLFNQIIDRGGQLVALFDSCHSGSMTLQAAESRPLEALDRTSAQTLAVGQMRRRYAPPNPVSGLELPQQRPAPEERGALVISAAQDFQSAHERPLGGPVRGVFTTALIQAIAESAPGDPISSVFVRVAALVRTYAGERAQMPVLAGTQPRRHQAFFGEVASDQGTLIAVGARTAGGVLVYGGLSLGLGLGAELIHTQDPSIRLIVTDVLDLGNSVGKVIAADPSKVRAGDLFKIHSFGRPVAAAIKVALGSGDLDEESLRASEVEVRSLAAALGDNHLVRPSLDAPSHRLRRELHGWSLFDAAGHRLTALPSAPQMPEWTAALRSISGLRLCIERPLTKQDLANIQGTIIRMSGLALVHNAAEADYVVTGCLGPGGSELYTLARPDQRPSFDPMPVRLDWGSAQSLTNKAVRLQRQKAWLSLSSPVVSRAQFPYQPVLVCQVGTKQIEIRPTMLAATTQNQQSCHLRLEWVSSDPVATVRGRFVYLFVMSNHGESRLLFPHDVHGSVQHFLPRQPYPVPQIEVPYSEFETDGEPSIDTYIMITSENEIMNPQAAFLLENYMSTKCNNFDISPILCSILSSRKPDEFIDKQSAKSLWSIDRIYVRHRMLAEK